MKNDHNIEQLFAQGETSKPISPPTHVWDRIDGKLQNKQIKKRVSLYKYISIAAIGICLIAILFSFEKTNDSLSSSYFIEDLASYELNDKSDINYIIHRKLIGSYTDKFEKVSF